MYAMDLHLSGGTSGNGASTNYDFNQYVAWYLLAGMAEFLESADMACQCDTLLFEIEKLRRWDEQHGDWYEPLRYANLSAEVREHRAQIVRDEMRYWNSIR